MKRLFTLLLITMLLTQPAFARHNHSWHHQDWIGFGIFSGLVTLTAAAIATEPAPVVQETVIVTQPQPVVVAAPAPVVVQQPVVQPVVVAQPVVQTTVVRTVPPSPPVVVRPMPPPPPPRRGPQPPRHRR